MAYGNNNSVVWVEAQIIEVLNERPGKRMNYKQISSRLGFNTKDERELTNLALNSLKSQKLIIENPAGSFYVEDKTDLLVGRIEFNKRGAGYLLMGAEKPDIHIMPGMTWPA